MSGREIYPNSVFENQTNGTVFYREGKLNDPMMPNQAGIFESWRYSFDSGRQVFKANGTDKVYEKRLIKDKYGNPHWSDWMEICPGEAHGIQAIAVNDRPLLLPNEDGAIKLQITPGMIDAYTKSEVLRLVDKKISSAYYEKNYEYVKWIEGCNSAYEVLNQTYPDGGKVDIYYLVEGKPEKGVANRASYYIYALQDDHSTIHNGYDFIEVACPANLDSFVSYPAFYEHTDDEVIHITQAEREKWNAAADFTDNSEQIINDVKDGLEIKISTIEETIANNFNTLDEKIDNNYNTLEKMIEDHVNDLPSVESPDSPHLSPDERSRLNEMFQNIRRMPENNYRYVVQNGNYTEAFEQERTSNEIKNELVKEYTGSSFKNGDYLINSEDLLRQKFNTIVSNNNLIKEFFVEISAIQQFGGNGYQWRLVSNTGWVSDWIEAGTNSQRFRISPGEIPENIFIQASDNDMKIIANFKFYISYTSKIAVDIGDSSKKLGLNLVGPEDAVPTYNDIPITDLVKKGAEESAVWGKITGDIEAQKDLNRRIASIVANKINHGDMNSHLRYDVYRDGIIKSICQQLENAEELEIEIKGDNGPRTNKSYLISGILDKVSELKESGFVIYSSKLQIENVAVFNNNEGNPVPVYFTTENPAIGQSPSVIGPFEWDWPGNLFDEYDKIIVNGDIEYVSGAKLVIKAIKYGDVTIGLKNELTGDFYNITIQGSDIINEANNIIFKADNILLGEEEIPYGAIKDKTIIKAYGQEIDERFAGKENFNELELRVTANEESISQVDSKVDENFETLNTKIDENADSINSKVDENAADINSKLETVDDKYDTAVADINSRIDAELSSLENYKGEVESKFEEIHTFTEESITNYKEDMAEKVNEAIENVNRIDEALQEEISNRTSNVEVLTSVVDNNGRAIQDIQSDLENVKNTYATKEELAATSFGDLESYDLTINSSEELGEAIADGSFANASRILFKKGDYVFTTDDRNLIDNPINFANIKYVKGEYPTTLTISNIGQVPPINVDNTKFEDISVSIGSGTNKFEIDDGNRVKTIEASGEVVVTLNPNIDVYKLLVTDEVRVTLKNAALDKEYKIYVDQVKDEISRVTFANFFENGSEELNLGLENQVPHKRTMLKISSDSTTIDGAFILNEMIYGLANDPTGENILEVVPVHTECEIYGTTETDTAVDMKPTSVRPGNVLSLTPTICAGFAHAKDGKDYSVSIEGGRVIGYGKCDETTTFTIPYGIKAKENGDMPKIIVEFNVRPQLALISLDPTYADYVKEGSVRGTIPVQTVYGTASFELEMKDAFYAYGYESDDGRFNDLKYEGSIPWKFTPSPRDDHEDYQILIKPLFYARFIDFTIETINGNYPFDKTKVALIGNNTFAINGLVDNSIKNDPRYGVLYTQAPITFVEAHDFDDESIERFEGVQGEVSLINNGKAQEGTFTFDESVVGKNVCLDFTVAGDDITVYHKPFYIGKINGNGVIKCNGEETNTLDTIVNEDREYEITIEYPDCAIDHLTGTWTSSNKSIVSVGNGSVDGDSNKVKVKAHAKGKAILTFQNNFTGLPDSIELTVVTHANKMICPNVTAVAERTIAPNIVYTDYNNKNIDPALITDPSFEYVNVDDSKFLNVEEKTNIKLTNAAFPENATVVEVNYSVNPSDENVEVESGKITITPAEYLISYTISKDSGITGHSFYGGETASSNIGYKAYAKGGQLLNFVISLEDGVTLSTEAIEAIANAFDDTHINYNKPGKFSALVKMPYHDISFEL